MIASHTTLLLILVNLILYPEDMLQSVIEAVFAVVDSRLQRQHRLIVATCFCLVSLNMTCEKEDYVKAFMVPLNLDQTWLWEGIVPAKKEEAEDEKQHEGKDVEEGIGKDEEKVEKEKKGKSDDEIEPETRPTEAMIGHEDQADETFPSWLPPECNKKVPFTVQLKFILTLEYE